MQTSAKGIEALALEEGVVLRAYRDVVGVWTIGAGLTAASGVIKPKAGMVITRAQADTLLAAALRKSYEPEVEVAMSIAGAVVTRPAPHAFDAGVSFHWNLGAIGRASWVRLWKAGAPRSEIQRAMVAWKKAGGKVLPGLTARRNRELWMLLDGVYRGDGPVQKNKVGTIGYAKWGLQLSGAEIAAARAGFAKLGYQPGEMADAILLVTAFRFQADHGLTTDGIIGRATLTALQRRLDARVKVAVPAASGAAAATTISTDTIPQISALPMITPILLAVGAVWVLSVAWNYRDVIAAKINQPLPRLAGFLRSL